MSTTAYATFSANITKGVDKTLVDQSGGSATFNYTVNVTTSGWVVSGAITVSNPNNWEDVTVNIGDALTDGTGLCSVTGGASVLVARGSSVSVPYSCAFASVPASAVGSNNASATWDSTVYSTPSASAMAAATYGFANLTITDTFNNVTSSLGTVTIPPGSATYTYARTVSVPTYGCSVYNNTATIVETSQSASQSVKVCGPTQTNVYNVWRWFDKGGQNIIKGASQSALGNFLKGYHAFSDAPTTNLAGYVTGIFTAAGCKTTAASCSIPCPTTAKSCNKQLRGEMLATALNVYFSDATLGGNKIKSPSPVGATLVDLTRIRTATNVYTDESGAFGGATSMSVSAMLTYQNTADPLADAGAAWYGQVKATQSMAQYSFNAVNNQVTFAP